jgi:hypothetical protein
MHKLVPVKVYNQGKFWSFNFAGGTKSFYGDFEKFRLFLKRIQAIDFDSTPKSKRQKTFDQIAQDVVSGVDNKIYVWKHILDKQDMFINYGEDVQDQIDIKELESDIKQLEIDKLETEDSQEKEDIQIKIDDLKDRIESLKQRESAMKEIKIKEEFKIPGTDIILEEGDKIQIKEDNREIEALFEAMGRNAKIKKLEYDLELEIKEEFNKFIENRPGYIDTEQFYEKNDIQYYVRRKYDYGELAFHQYELARYRSE